MRRRTLRLFVLLAGTFMLLLTTATVSLSAVSTSAAAPNAAAPSAAVLPVQQASPPDNTPLSPEALEQFWQEMYPSAEPFGAASVSNVYTHALLAKAEPDECFNGLGIPITITDIVPDCENGIAKVNEAYVWGLTDYADTSWFGTAPNVHCLVMGAFLGSTTPIPSDSYVCEFDLGPYVPPLPAQIGDWRPPSAYVYDHVTTALTEVSPNGEDGRFFDPRFVSNTLGIRSAATLGDFIFMAGPAFTPTGSINVFLFHAPTQTYRGAANLPAYNNIRKWLEVDGVLYAAVGKGEDGAILRYTGDPTSVNPLLRFSFIEVGAVDEDAAELALYEGRIFVNTWPGSLGSGGGDVGGLWMSPVVPSDGLTTTDLLDWQKVFAYDEYEPDPLIAQTYGGGALHEFEGDLYWGTMHVPFLATTAHLQYYAEDYAATEQGRPDPNDLLNAMYGSQRAITIFKGRNFDTAREVEVAYGMPQLPAFDPDSLTWSLTDTLLGPPLYGLSGFNNMFNNYTWSMAEYDGQLFVGTMDWSYLIEDLIDTLLNLVELPLDIEINLPDATPGADLYRFFDVNTEAVPVSLSGVGNYSSYGIRNMVGREDGLYLGMANPMNLLTDLNDDKPEGGWELIRLTRHLISLSVGLGGNGSGSVVGSLDGIDCGSSCNAAYDYGTSGVLTPTADVGSTFTGWSNVCFGLGSCPVTLLADTELTANFTLDTHTLNVTLAGDGSGSVISDPAGINCGTACDESYNYGTTVILTPAATAGSLFAGWDGDCTGMDECEVTITAGTQVTATFINNHFPLAVGLAGDGSGNVMSDPAGINCGTQCDASYDGGTTVILTPTAAAGSLFLGWSGACAGDAPCAVTIAASNAATATFVNNRFPLTVNLAGDGSGSIVSDPAGINCGTTCNASYDGGTTVVLTPTAAAGSIFTGWNGACSGVAACAVSITESAQVTATFANNRFPLVVNINGGGSGFVSSLPLGMACSQPSCSASFDNGTVVSLSAIAFSGSSFEGWGGACSGADTCQVTIGPGTTVVNASFGQDPNAATLEVGGTPLVGSQLIFTATLNLNPITECTWDFGDGTTEACEVDVAAAGAEAVHDVEIQTTHVYTQAGIYIVIVSASNGAGTVVAAQQVAIQTPTGEEPTQQPSGPADLFFPFLNRD